MSDLKPLTFSIGKGSWTLSPKFHEFADFLGLIERDAKGVVWKVDERTKERLGQIYLWGVFKAKTTDIDKVKEQVYELQRKVGNNWTEKTLVDRLWDQTMFDSSFQKNLDGLLKYDKKKKEEKETKVDRPKKAKPAQGKELGKVEPIKKEPERELKIKESPGGELKSEPIKI